MYIRRKRKIHACPLVKNVVLTVNTHITLRGLSPFLHMRIDPKWHRFSFFFALVLLEIRICVWNVGGLSIHVYFLYWRRIWNSCETYNNIHHLAHPITDADRSNDDFDWIPAGTERHYWEPHCFCVVWIHSHRNGIGFGWTYLLGGIHVDSTL